MESRANSHILVVLAGLVCALWSYPWLEARRPSNPSGAPARQFWVTNSLNHGPGTLREAIFGALRSGESAEIILETVDVYVDTPLPPLVGSSTIILRSANARATIDASKLSEGPLFDVRTGQVEFRNLAISGAGDVAVRASGNAARLRLSEVSITGGDVGVGTVGDATLEIDQSKLSYNRIGVEVLGHGATRIHNSSFENQSEAGLWAVGPPRLPSGVSPVEAQGNRFADGRYGIVLGNVDSLLQDNDIDGFAADGVLVIGGILEASDNRILNVRGVGLRVVGIGEGTIRRNEIHENGAIGILLQAAATARVEDNRVYRNGYGIATVLNDRASAVQLRNNLVLAQTLDGLVAIGDSPLIADNRALRNRVAGIRIFHLVRSTSYVRASPLLVRNTLRENGLNEPVYSEYRIDAETE